MDSCGEKRRAYGNMVEKEEKNWSSDDFLFQNLLGGREMRAEPSAARVLRVLERLIL